MLQNGLLQEILDAIEFVLKSSEFEQFDAALFSKLAKMGLQGISEEYMTPYHFLALKPLRRHNSEMNIEAAALKYWWLNLTTPYRTF